MDTTTHNGIHSPIWYLSINLCILYKNKSLPWKHIIIEQNHSPHSTFPLTTEFDQQYELIHSGRTLSSSCCCVPVRQDESVSHSVLTGSHAAISHCAGRTFLLHPSLSGFSFVVDSLTQLEEMNYGKGEALRIHR